MKLEYATPEALAQTLVQLFPVFDSELEEALEGDMLQSHHELLMILAPVLHGYLQQADERRKAEFAELINTMARAGGSYENAVATILLEHATKLNVRKMLQPRLCPEARRELR